MGQYFNWVNFDKREFIETNIWPNGQKLLESCFVGCIETDAALTMLAGEWAGDFVVFLGDYANFSTSKIPAAERGREALAGCCAEDFVFECEDITGRFDYASNLELLRYDYDTDELKPYDGPFDIEIKHYRYVVNETKREFGDRGNTPIDYIDPNSGEFTRFDPVPELMSYEDYGFVWPGEEVAGLWFGDVIRPTNDRPGSEYEERFNDYSYFKPFLANCTDEEVREIIKKHHLKIDDKDIISKIADYLGRE